MVHNGHPRAHRLLTAGDFRSVFDQVDVKAACPELLLLARTSHTAQARLGFILSRKNCRSAVARNRVKRVAREVFRCGYAQWPQLDIILMGRSGIDQLSTAQLHQLIDKQLQRLSRRWRKSQTDHAE
ncbi:ribonuclease P protein component [Saccharospirillum mangrovi]|uniref:ribonuclease P protein component n=1 Tax=Saccharospirillum mangrovi TaxID=2161747 RepID=UPI000D33A413|nr:ribonuclease P protein component [Saccharospirillum mangrovi]